jgi:hypothetical protein
VLVEDLGEKEAVARRTAQGFLTIPHFDGFPAVLIQLRKVSKKALREVALSSHCAA